MFPKDMITLAKIQEEHNLTSAEAIMVVGAMVPLSLKEALTRHFPNLKAFFQVRKRFL
jgi:hypothetical protein